MSSNSKKTDSGKSKTGQDSKAKDKKNNGSSNTEVDTELTEKKIEKAAEDLGCENKAESAGKTSERRDSDKKEKSKNPFASFVSWAGLLWFALKTFVFFTVMFTSIAFGAVFGVTIYRTYFAVPEEVEVPAIQGQDFAKANDFLKGLGLRLRLTEGRHTSKFPNRVIISQEPAPGKSVRRNREILAVVSLGPEVIKVPSLKGHSLREVQKILANNKLAVGKVTYVQKDSSRPEEIIEQTPVSGSFAKKGDKVNITINKGFGMAKVVVPNCLDMKFKKASSLLEKSNLNIGKVSWSASSETPAGQVISQSPPASSNVMNDSEVELEVSLGAGSRNMLCRHKLDLFLPAGSEPQDVRILLVSGNNEDEVYQASHVMGDKLSMWVVGAPGSDLEVYVNDKLFMRDKL